MGTPQGVVRGYSLSKAIFGLSAMLLAFAPTTARRGDAAEVYDSTFAADISRFAPPRPARRPRSRSRSEPQSAALRRSGRRIARVRSCSVRRLPTWPEATCEVLANRPGRIQSGRLFSPDRTFRRRSPIGSRPRQRPPHHRFSARRASISEVSR